MNKLTLIIVFTILELSSLNAQNFKKYYKDKLEPKSKCIISGGNYTIERTKDKKYIFKTYYPTTKQITQIITAKDKKFKKIDGLFQKNYDNGKIVQKGYYSDGQKIGKWIENITNNGEYINNLKEGEWLTFNEDSTIYSRSFYLNGVLNGKKYYYDSLSQIKYTEEYKNGELIYTSQKFVRDGLTFSEEMPRFPGCEDLELDSILLKKCSDQKLLEYIYSNLKYPKKARENDIEGKALVQFEVNEKGYVEEVIVLNGICKEIETLCIELINSMPKWRPGFQRGKPVSVLYTLPINFKFK